MFAEFWIGARSRLSYWKPTAFWGWWKVGVLIFALAGAYEFFQPKISAVNLPPLNVLSWSWWDWKIWIILALVCALAGTMEGSYRYAKVLKLKKEELQSRLDIKAKRKSIADELATLYLDGESIRATIIQPDFKGDALRLYNDWGDRIKSYFWDNPEELGQAMLIRVVPSLKELSMQVPAGFSLSREARYACVMLVEQTDKLKKMVEEFSR